jgi:hypothetical protein
LIIIVVEGEGRRVDGSVRGFHAVVNAAPIDVRQRSAVSSAVSRPLIPMHARSETCCEQDDA